MLVTCPACARRLAVTEPERTVHCGCGCRFSALDRPTVADPFLGRDVNGYRIEELLGVGGMGTVYRATQLSLGRSVAIKVLPDAVKDDPQFLARFHREAEILASLSHRNIVSVFDRGEWEGRYFIIMEYIEGESVRQMLRRGRVEPDTACRIASALLEALDYAHDHDVIHRDVKPENVLIGNDGAVKVADFGLSRVIGADEAEPRLTRTRMVMGTYEYMAPELREGTRDADPRCDVYATAVLFYEMLTGELPIGRFPMASEKVAGLDGRIDRILDLGLKKERESRYQHASEMGRDLGKLFSGADHARPLAGAVQETPSRASVAPTVYDSRYDLMLTILGVCGIVGMILGGFILIGGEQLNIGAYELDQGVAGLIVIVFGFVLVRTVNAARRFGGMSRSTLLALTLLAAPTIAGIPFAVWAWVLLLNRKMRVYLDARERGLDGIEAAGLADGIAPAPRPRPEVVDRRKRAVAMNRLAAVLFTIGSAALLLTAIIVAVDRPSRMDDASFLVPLFASLANGAAAIVYWKLARKVAADQATKTNAALWSFTSWFTPRTSKRARMLHKDAHPTDRSPLPMLAQVFGILVLLASLLVAFVTWFS